MPDWESELKGPPLGKEWSKLDVLAEVARVATIEYHLLHSAAIDDPQAKAENSLEESVIQKKKKNVNYLGSDPFVSVPKNSRRVVLTRPLTIQEPYHESSTSSSPILNCNDRLKRPFKLGSYPAEKTQFKKPKKGNLDRPSSSSSPGELYSEIGNLIREMNALDPRLVIKKKLFKTDISSNHGRLSIPLNHMVEKDFLTSEEDRIIDERCRGISKDDVGVVLVDPSSRKWNVNLRRWDMKKESGNSSSMYVLVSGWNDFVKANGLKEGDIIQLWAFRSEQKLHFSLLLLERGPGSSGESSSV